MTGKLINKMKSRGENLSTQKQLARAEPHLLYVTHTNICAHVLGDTYKCPCSKCCSSHDVQETPQLPSFCLERITLMHHMTLSWWLFPSLITTDSLYSLSNAVCETQCAGPHWINTQLITCNNILTLDSKFLHCLCIAFLCTQMNCFAPVVRGLLKTAQENNSTPGFRLPVLLQPF